jgi:hypothetical protein
VQTNNDIDAEANGKRIGQVIQRGRSKPKMIGTDEESALQ